MTLGENILCNLMEQCFFSNKDKHISKLAVLKAAKNRELG